MLDKRIISATILCKDEPGKHLLIISIQLQPLRKKYFNEYWIFGRDSKRLIFSVPNSIEKIIFSLLHDKGFVDPLLSL